MQVYLVLIIATLIISLCFFIKNKNNYIGFNLLILIVSVFLFLFNISMFGQVLYWISLLLLFFYSFLKKRKKKFTLILFTLPFLIDEIFRVQHYPKFFFLNLLFLIPFILYIYIILNYKKYKKEFSILTMIIGLNTITLLKMLNYL